MDMILMIFSLILKSSLKASITALLIILIKKLFNNVISARLHYVLWFLVLIRLFIPFLPESHLSLFNIFESKSIELDLEENSSLQITSSINSKLSQEELNENQWIDTYDDNNLVKQNNSIKITFLKMLSLIWFIGFLFMLLLVSQSMIRIKLKTKYFNRVTNTNILLVANKCKEKLKINKEITIYTGDYFKSPCILGIINPYIYYPSNMLTNTNYDKLYHIFLHELAHYKRKDTLSNLLKVLALSIHWFNPIIWICIKKMHRDIELACDAYVLEVIGEKEAVSYGNTIIECLKHLSLVKLQPNVLFFYESNNQFERRIRMIKDFKKGSYKISVATVVFFTIIGAIILTNGVTTNAVIPENNKNFSAQNDSNPITEPIYKDKLVVIDPGHGDHDPGAINSELNLKEKEVVLDISLKLKELLENTGFKVYMTRKDDTYVGLNERADAANNLKADAYISIHVGAHMDKAIEGIVSIYSSVDDRDNKTFATIVKNSVVKELNASDKGIIERNNFIVLKETKMPAISLELGFLTNPKEEKLMQENDYRQSCAEGIHKGVIEYFNKVLSK